jgi:hypothetical protein
MSIAFRLFRRYRGESIEKFMMSRPEIFRVTWESRVRK